ncbi:TetR/AcrR family transcriptional regulator [Sphingobacterium sp. R2]|uniref:TetR/AcrR family transcriptional regulator n=1 Tax=Sphingobacterium sp. R2 TaxID=3112958 RepID=UPI00345CA161
MKNAYKRKKEPVHNRQIVLDAALEIATSADWSQVTFQAIADKTGLSKGGIIHHFKNKDELLDELMKQNLSHLTDFLKAYQEQQGITNNAKSYLKFVLKNGDNMAYQKIMRVIVQAILVKDEYRTLWEDWLKENILPDVTKGSNIQNLIFFLVAEGIWYNDSVGFSYLNYTLRKRILKHLVDNEIQ